MPTITVNGVSVLPGASVNLGNIDIGTGSEPDWTKKIPDYGQLPADPGLGGGIKNDDSIANVVFSNPNDPVTNTLGNVVRSVSDATNSLAGIGAGQNMGKELDMISSDETGYHGKIDTRLKTMYSAWLEKLSGDVNYLEKNSSKFDNARTVTATFNGPPENVRNSISNLLANRKNINTREAATIMMIPGVKAGINQGNPNDFNVNQSNTGSALKKTITNVKKTLGSLDTAIKETKVNQHSFISQELKSTQASQVSGMANTTEDGISELGEQPVPGIQNALPAGTNKQTDIFNLGMGQGKVDSLIKQGVQQLGNGLSNAFGSFAPVNKSDTGSNFINSGGYAKIFGAGTDDASKQAASMSVVKNVLNPQEVMKVVMSNPTDAAVAKSMGEDKVLIMISSGDIGMFTSSTKDKLLSQVSGSVATNMASSLGKGMSTLNKNRLTSTLTTNLNKIMRSNYGQVMNGGLINVLEQNNSTIMDDGVLSQLTNSGPAKAAASINKPGSKLSVKLNEKLHTDVLNNLSSPTLKSVSGKIDSISKSRMGNILSGIPNAEECSALASNMGTEYGIVPKDTVVFSTSGEDDTEMSNKINEAIEGSKENFKNKTFTMKVIYGV